MLENGSREPCLTATTRPNVLTISRFRVSTINAMPRGYLKNDRTAGRKQSRGGSSRGKTKSRDQKSKSTTSRFSTKRTTTRIESSTAKLVQDVPLQEPRTYQGQMKPVLSRSPAVARYPEKECGICFEYGPVVCLSQKTCGWHPSACQSCLRKWYTREYSPCSLTKCFHPQCQQSVYENQLQKHGILGSAMELRKYRESVLLSKTVGKKVVVCPHCSFPRAVYGESRARGSPERSYSCRHCLQKYLVSFEIATILCLLTLPNDSMGRNDGWARCPGCSILISKGDGCSHMVCGCCGTDFCWSEATPKYPLARPPPDQMYLWW